MLKTLRSNVFDKKEPIIFNKGLNIMKGDKIASNSIGKSTFLIIIDFILGGKDYLSKNGGAISVLGDHFFEFSFTFNNIDYYFIRDTENPDIISKCNSKFETVKELTLKEYTAFLKKEYNLEDFPNSFRDIISTYIRAWGRENLNPQKPLESFSGEKQDSSINRIIKLFKKYYLIEESLKLYDEVNNDSKALNRLFNKEYFKKITKTKFKENKILISQLQSELKEMKEEMTKGILNFEDLKNKELLEKYQIRKNLTQKKNLIELQLKKLEKAKLKKTSISEKELYKINEFFPNINKEKMALCQLWGY